MIDTRLAARSTRLLALLGGAATLALAAPAHANGTVAGAVIDNTATATYTPSGGGADISIDSNTVSLTVDELLEVTVATADTGDIVATPGAADQMASFIVTNNGNGSEAFALAAVTAVGGDDFDPTFGSIVIDDGDGNYEPAQDLVYQPGINDPVLAPDASAKIFVFAEIPASAANGQRAEIQLTAVARTGSGAPGTSFAGLGQGGGDAVVGATRADGVDSSFYAVQAASVGFLKSAVVADPFGGGETVPGATVTYTLVATVSGSGSLANLRLADPIPTGTTYRPGTLTLQGAALSDPADADAGEIASGAVAVRLGSVAAGQSRTVTFQVRID